MIHYMIRYVFNSINNIIIIKYNSAIEFSNTFSLFIKILSCKKDTFTKKYLLVHNIILLFWFINLVYFIPELYSLCELIGYCLYWLMLGVLSSIGFGTGLQTGILFVFPYIINDYNHHFNPLLSDRTNIYNSYYRCFPRVVIWGVGSALGELPPFIIARGLNYKDSGSFTTLSKLIGIDSNKIKNSIGNIISKFKDNRKYSFFSILIFSAYPNAIFDMCGIAAGMVGLDLYEFIIPTIIGKGLIKTPVQLFLVLYSYVSYGQSITQIELGYLYYLWIVIVSVFTLYITKCYIENFVQYHMITH